MNDIETTPWTTGRHGKLAPLTLGALGIVYGDIGTSQLYTIKTAVEWAGGALAPAEALGILSLIVWTLIIITSNKYVAVIMRADNDAVQHATGESVELIHVDQGYAAENAGKGARRRVRSRLGPQPKIPPFGRIFPDSTAAGKHALFPQVSPGRSRRRATETLRAPGKAATGVRVSRRLFRVVGCGASGQETEGCFSPASRGSDAARPSPCAGLCSASAVRLGYICDFRHLPKRALRGGHVHSGAWTLPMRANELLSLLYCANPGG